MSRNKPKAVPAMKDAVCMDCRALQLRVDADGQTFYWCRTRRRRRPEALLFAPACRRMVPQAWD